MTMLDDAPTEEVAEPMAPIPSWDFMRRNQVKITYVSTGVQGHRTLVGRVTHTTRDIVTIQHHQTGVPSEIHRERIRSIVIMKEGDVAGRARSTAVRALTLAAKALSDPNHVGGNQREAANLLAFVQALIPTLGKGDPEHVWATIQALGIELS